MKIIHKITLNFILLCLFGISFSSMQAQENKDLPLFPDDSLSFELAPVEIKAIRAGKKTPFALANMDSTHINKENGVQDIPYLLDQTPSVVISSDAGAGVGYSSIRIRGTDPSRINFTMNGIPINDAESQAAIFVDFPDILGSTESIQIQRGVGSSTNGAGAFGASVNMDILGQGKKAYATYDVGAGSFNTLKNSIKAGTGMLDGGFQFDVRLSKITSDGYIDRSSSDLKSFQFIAGWTSKDEKTNIKFNLLTGKEKTGQAWGGVPEDSLKTNRRYNGLGLMENGDYYKDQTDNYQQDYYQLFFNHQFNANWDAHIALFLTRGLGFYNEYKQDQTFSEYFQPDFTTPMGDTLSTTNLTRQMYLDNYYYGTTYSLNYQKNNTEINLGGNYSRYDGEHYGFVTWADYGFPVDYDWYDMDAFKNDFSVFAKLQQQLVDRLYFFGDMQYRHIRHQMNGFRRNPGVYPDVSYNFLNPKAGLSYIKTHEDRSVSKAFASFAVAHKEPNRSDFEASTEELPNPEVLYDTEIGYEYRGHQWSAGINGYYMYYRDQLVQTGKINDVGAYTRQNVAKSYRAGLELTAAYQPIPQLSLTANATLSENKIKDFHEFIDDYDQGGQIENTYSSTDIAFSPNFVAYGEASIEPFAQQWQDQRLFIDIIGKHISRQYLDNTTNENRSIDPYTLANLRFRYTLKPGFLKELGLHLSLNNVFDKKYVSNGYTFSYVAGGETTTENFYFPQAGFNFILGAEIKF